MYEGKNQYHYALSSNQAWAGYKFHQNPDFFRNQAIGETPSILWLGCSDSRIPETTILGCQPGDVFTHRNFAAIVSPTDINTSATLEFAVAHLKVKHIILSSHTSCPASAACLSGTRVGGVLDTWLTPLKSVVARHWDELQVIKDEHSRGARVAELGVEAGVEVIMSNWVVREAVKERGLEVHGCIFDVSTGRLRDLGIGTDGIQRGSIVGGDEVVRGRHATLVFRDGGATMTAQ
ncbi:related to carbonic anhydrase [Cephalotrichum gorgonifer]|uniref:Carbonic anhydrase n=1 Tax=Cephalotrichum gorgonifer TaxID=2041049 RepID=A0AAE8MS52_9PEZI|nr:related to carbonic anhydrase [Cephalotrichum gorgonifer]